MRNTIMLGPLVALIVGFTAPAAMADHDRRGYHPHAYHLDSGRHHHASKPRGTSSRHHRHHRARSHQAHHHRAHHHRVGPPSWAMERRGSSSSHHRYRHSQGGRAEIPLITLGGEPIVSLQIAP